MTIKKIFFVAISTFALSSCATAKKEAAPPPPNIRNEFSKASAEVNAGKSKQAILRLNRVAETHKESTAAHDAYLAMGQIYFKQNDFNNSYRAYLAVLNSEYATVRDAEARIGAARALQKLGRYDEALALTKRATQSKEATPAIRLEAYLLHYHLLQQTGDRLEALKALAYLAQNTQSKENRDAYQMRALEMVNTKLAPTDVEKVASGSEFGFVRPYALLKVGKIAFENKNYSAAESTLNSVVSLAPGTDLAVEAQKYISQIEGRRRVDPLVVGAVLPLTGKQSAVAYKTLKGLELGLGVTGRNTSNIKLAVMDSEGHPDTARRAVERLVVEDSAVTIVGDIISRTSEVVAQKSEELGVPNIALSQRAGLTNIGSYVFRNALTSESQVRELVRVAMEVQGMKKFAILYPNDAYGTEYANIFWDEVLNRGGEIVAVQTYAPDEKDFSQVIRRLVGTFYLEDRADEYGALLKDWYSKQKTMNSRTETPDDILPPITRFDGIFIPDGVKALGQISSMLTYNDIPTTKLLGTNLWNTKEVVERAAKLAEGALFVDASSSIDQSYQNSAFFREYRETYGEDPSVFEAQAYDTGLVLRRLLTSGVTSRAGLRSDLESVGSFTGSVGSIQIDKNREFSRPLTVMSIAQGQIVPLQNQPVRKR